MLYFVLGIIAFVVIVYFLLATFYPSFGGNVGAERQKIYANSAQFHDGKFNNKKAVPKDLGFSKTLEIGYKFFTTKVPHGRPNSDLQVEKIDSTAIANYKGDARFIWYGHSAFLLQINHKNILLDPMFGEVASPLSMFGDKRFNAEFPLEIEKLPAIDAVIISHDHYDHLDYGSIQKLKSKALFCTTGRWCSFRSLGNRFKSNFGARLVARNRI